MKIALVSPYGLEVFGGVQNQVRGLAAALAEREDVTVISPGRPIAVGDALSTGVGRISSVPANGSRAPIALAPRSWTETRDLLRNIRPDVVHIHEPFVPMVGLAALRSDVAPVVATFHRSGAGRLYPLLAPLLRRDFQRCGARVAVSDEARDTLRRVFGPIVDSMPVLANAIDLERFSRASAHAPTAQPVIIFVGRHEARKGLSVLLQAFGAGIGDARLEVIGDGPEHAKLLQRFNRPGVVDFLGALDDQAMADRVAAAEVLVAPSLSGESFGVVLLEAMAAKTAVLASAIPGYQLAAGDAAAFFPPGDAAALRRALTELLASGERRTELVSRGELRASGHSFTALATQYQTIYRSLLAS